MADYQVFLPLVTNNAQPQQNPEINPNKGIALVENYLQDLDTVGASWYYTWTHYPKPKEDKRYVPMSYYGLFDEDLPLDHDGFVLFMNEPNNPAPFGANIDAITAAKRYKDLITARPKAKVVFGNTSAWANGWHYDFIHEVKLYGIELPKYVGIHCYIEQHITVDVIDFYINQMRLTWQVEAGYIPEFWITEFADTVGNTEELKKLLNLFKSKWFITRLAYFTNRYDPDAAYIPDGWYDFNLVNDDGSLSAMGEVYKG